MEARKIGSLTVPLVGIGCNNFGWRIDAAATAKVVDAALDAGAHFFDTADIYGDGQSEDFLGRALEGKRDRAIIATKFGMKLGGFAGGAKASYVRASVEGSLKRLRTDVIDLYQIHKPDPGTLIADTLGALDELVTAGKVREIGCSNFSAGQLREAAGAVQPGRARFVSVQNDYSMLQREPEAEVLPECTRQGLTFLPYFPLASGLLTGKYHKGQPFPDASRGKDAFGPKVFTGENLTKVEILASFAEQRGHTLLELAFAYLAAHPQVACVIAGAKTPEQVRANAASGAWHLSEDDLTQLSGILA